MGGMQLFWTLELLSLMPARARWRPPTMSCEERVRAALLDVLHAQWRELGVPFQAPAFEHPLEVIDPEALLWCSLHFFGSEPRLEEAVRSWFTANRARINTQRLNTLHDENKVILAQRKHRIDAAFLRIGVDTEAEKFCGEFLVADGGYADFGGESFVEDRGVVLRDFCGDPHRAEVEDLHECCVWFDGCAEVGLRAGD